MHPLLLLTALSLLSTPALTHLLPSPTFHHTLHPLIGACADTPHLLTDTYTVRIPRGARYNDPARPCGSGFRDNLRAVGARGWRCAVVRGGGRGADDVLVRFSAGKGGRQAVREAFQRATYGEVDVGCAARGEVEGQREGFLETERRAGRVW